MSLRVKVQDKKQYYVFESKSTSEVRLMNCLI